MTNVEVQQDMESVDKHWTAHLHTAFVLYKAAETLYGTLSAARVWNKTNMKMGGPVQMLLLFNAIVCLAVTAYKFTSKTIAPLFVLQTLAQYGFFLAFTVLIEFNENPKIREAGRKILKILTPLHAIYGFVIFYGYFKKSKCTEETPYPLSYVIGDILFFVTFFACMRFSK